MGRQKKRWIVLLKDFWRFEEIDRGRWGFINMALKSCLNVNFFYLEIWNVNLRRKSSNFSIQQLIISLGHTSFSEGGGDSNASYEGKGNFYGTTSSARAWSAVEDSRWRTWAVSWFRCTEEYCLRCFADTLICCGCSNMVDFHLKRTICFLATMLIEDLKDWNASVCSSPTRSNTPRTFLCWEEIMNAHPSIESTGMKCRTIRWT